VNDPISTPQVPPIPLVPAEMLHALTVARAEIARLRLAIRRLAEQDATLSLLCKRDGSQVVTVTMDATLTDAERKAIEGAIDCCEDITYGGAANQEAADVLKALLKRTK